VKKRFQQSSNRYNKREDFKRRENAFAEGEILMAHIWKKMFLGDTYKSSTIRK